MAQERVTSQHREETVRWDAGGLEATLVLCERGAAASTTEKRAARSER